MAPVKVAIVGLGNCASALVQGVHYYSDPNKSGDGLVQPVIGSYAISDISFVVAFDVDARKIGWPIQRAIFQKPNCCMTISAAVAEDASGRFDGPVLAAPILDGVADHMKAQNAEDAERFFVAGGALDVEADVLRFAEALATYRADVLLNYLPVGSQLATEFWARVCLQARVPMVNCIPVFLASNPAWSNEFAKARVALIGDDMKSQFGASVLSQAFQELAEARGHRVVAHIQQNSGGNTDFMNMLARERLASKKVSKENVLRQHGAAPEFLHAGPSDYVRYYNDTKVAHFQLDLVGFGGAPVKLTARLEVQDSPNSAGVVIDALRYVRTAQDRGIFGALHGPSAFTQKSPPEPMTLAEAQSACQRLGASV